MNDYLFYGSFGVLIAVSILGLIAGHQKLKEIRRYTKKVEDKYPLDVPKNKQ